MALSKKEKDKIDQIANAVEKEKPVEDLGKERRKRKSGKQLEEGKHQHVMGETIPLEKRCPGLAEKLVSSTKPLWGPTIMGLVLPPLGRGKAKPKEDNSSGKTSKPRPERTKKKTGRNDESSKK